MEKSVSETGKFRIDSMLINEAQLILSEKRTSLSTLRTGIAVSVLPLSVLSFLIATSRFYDILQVIPLLTPLLLITTGLILLGIYLITRAVIKIRHYDDLLAGLKIKNESLAEIID
jgi:uncharacterized membrane protein YkgB